MDKIPFTSYDFWAYLSAGLLLLVAVDVSAGTYVLMRESWTISTAALVISAAYITGHLVAGLSSWLLEGCLVGRVLGFPRDVLFGQKRGFRLARLMLPTYYRPLPPKVRDAVGEKARAAHIEEHGEGLFLLAYNSARENSVVMTRLNNFLNLYGFCRNIALVAVLDALIAAYTGIGLPTHGYRVISAVMLLVAVGMTLRFLKFYRLFAVEVFTAFAFTRPRDKG